MKLTPRQTSVLEYLKAAQVISSDHNGSVLRTLESKGLVGRHHNSAPGYVYYTWTLTEKGKQL